MAQILQYGQPRSGDFTLLDQVEWMLEEDKG